MGVFSRIRDVLRSSLWFIPAVLVIGAIVLASGLVALDSYIGRDSFKNWPLLFGAGADGSREVLSAIAGSMITVAGVTFSITVVALSLTASQYSSRVLRNFMRDRANQTVLGVFLAVFVYCLVVLRVIRSEDGEAAFVPELSVLMGVVLALVAVAFLVFFIHHVAASLQAVAIISAASHETQSAIDRLFPDELGEELEQSESRDVSLPAGAAWHIVPARHTGYLQGVDSDALLDFAKAQHAIVRMERSIGEFVVAGTPLVSLGAVSPPDADAVRELNRAYFINVQRTVYQDPSFGLQQLVDIALKALSPGVNDTTTAVICIDHLSAVLARAATRHRVADFRYEKGELRVIARGATFHTLVSDAFEQIRRNAEGNLAAVLRLFDALATVGHVTRNGNRRAVLREQVQRVWEVGERTAKGDHDRRLIEERRDRAFRLLDSGSC